MTDILDLPGTITFTLGRKDILRKLWSTYTSKRTASAHDHAHYLALDAALSLPENQEACFKQKLGAAFQPSKDPVRLANGYTPYLLNQHGYDGLYGAQMALKHAIAARASKSVYAGTGFLALSLNSIPIEALARALELLKTMKVLDE